MTSPLIATTLVSRLVALTHFFEQTTPSWNHYTMRLVIKSILAILLLGLLLIVSSLLLIQYSPQSLLSLSQYVSPYHVVAEEIDIDLSAPSANISGLQVNSSDETITTLEAFTFTTSWQSLRENSQDWIASAKNGVVHLNKLSQNEEEATSETSAPNIASLHDILQKANISVENIVLNITETSSAKLDYLRRPGALQTGEQGVEFSFSYQQDAITLPLQGTLLSRINEGTPEITLNLPTLDLRELMSEKNNLGTGSNESTGSNTGTNQEARIDWSSLSQLTPLNLLFQSEKIHLPQGEISSIRSRITLTNAEGVQGIQQEHTANVNVNLNKDYAINQTVAVRADWKILGERTEGADIDGNTTVSLGDNNINITGKVNLNGMLEQDMTLTATIQQFPAKTLSKQATRQQKEIERLLPFKGNAKITLQKGQLTLRDFTANAKDSNLNGKLAIGFGKDIIDLRRVTFDLNSTLLVIPQLESATTNTTTNNTNSTKNTTKNSKPLEWLNTLTAEGSIKLGKVIYKNEPLLNNATLQLNLQKQKLTLNNIAINTTDSDISGNISLGFDKAITDLHTVTFDINSKKLVIPSLGDNEVTARSAENTTKKESNNKAESNIIPVEWLNKITANGSVNLSEITYKNDTIVTGARTKIDLQKNKLRLNDIAITTKDSDFGGNVTIDFNEKATHLYATTFDLSSTQLTIPDDEKTNQQTANSQPSAKSNTLFNDNQLPTDWLNTIKAEGNISIAKVIRHNKTLASNTNNRITLDKDIFNLNSQIGSIAGGNSNLNLSIDNTDNKLAINLNASAKNIVLENLGLVPKEELSGGTSDINMTLNTYGTSTKALANHLQGDILFTAKDGVIANNTFEAIGSDVLLKLVNTINPFHKSAKTTNLECAVVKSKIVDGKMLFDNSIAIKTSKMIIIADGEIDLTTEQVNLGINPKARQGVGIDVASLAKFVALQGPLTKPTVGVSAKGTAKSLLSIGAAISTGGLSLLATKLADTVISGDPCEVAKNAFTQKPDGTPEP